MNKFKVLIIEDEEKSFEYITSLVLNFYSCFQIIGQARSVEDSIIKIKQFQPDLVFMDIVLIDGTSFEILDEFVEVNFEIIFISGYDTFYKKAFEHFAINYILKPIVIKAFKKSVDRFLKLKVGQNNTRISHFKQFINDRDASLLLQTGNEYVSVKIRNILYCEANGNYSQFHFVDGRAFLVSKLLKYYEELLEKKGFFRASRYCLINISQIKTIYKKETIILNNNKKIHVSTRNRPNLSALIESFS